jgi:hypothetical protein
MRSCCQEEVFRIYRIRRILRDGARVLSDLHEFLLEEVQRDWEKERAGRELPKEMRRRLALQVFGPYGSENGKGAGFGSPPVAGRRP